MATTYQLPNADDGLPDLLHQVMRAHRPELHRFQVKVSVLLAAADGEDEPALAHKGVKVVARVRVVPLMYRVLGAGDALLEIDARDWRAMRPERRLALLHHELCHLEVITDKETGRPKRDDIGRPKLRTVPGDVTPPDGFGEVIYAHGDDALEFEGWRRAMGYAEASRPKPAES